VLYYKDRNTFKETIVVPLKLRKSILLECHDDPISGHLGMFKTYSKIKARYYWPKMRKDICKYVQSCDACQKRKIPTTKRTGKMQFFDVNEQPFSRLQVDIMGPFKRSSCGKKYVVTAIDYLTKWIEARALAEANTETVANFLVEQIMCRHSCPTIIQTDRGTTFTSELFQEVMKKLGISHQISTAYHPESQGLVERSHATLTNCLSIYTDANQKNWPKFLHHIVFGINCSVQETTQHSSFFLLYGREATLPIEASIGLSKYPQLDEIIAQGQEARKIAKSNIEIRQKQYAEAINKDRRESPFKVGDQVLLRKFTKKRGFSSKLFHYYYGPYTIIEQKSPVNFIIEMRTKTRTYRETVHCDKLKFYYERDAFKNEPDSDPKCKETKEPPPPASIIPPSSTVVPTQKSQNVLGKQFDNQTASSSECFDDQPKHDLDTNSQSESSSISEEQESIIPRYNLRPRRTTSRIPAYNKTQKPKKISKSPPNKNILPSRPSLRRSPRNVRVVTNSAWRKTWLS
jgi:hypothetical protein